VPQSDYWRYGLWAPDICSVVCLSVCLSGCVCVGHACVLWEYGLTDRDAVCGWLVWVRRTMHRWGPDRTSPFADARMTRWRCGLLPNYFRHVFHDAIAWRKRELDTTAIFMQEWIQEDWGIDPSISYLFSLLSRPITLVFLSLSCFISNSYPQTPSMMYPPSEVAGL